MSPQAFLLLLFFSLCLTIQSKAQNTKDKLYTASFGLDRSGIMKMMTYVDSFILNDEDVSKYGQKYLSYKEHSSTLVITFYFTDNKCSHVVVLAPEEVSTQMFTSLRQDGFKYDKTGYWINDEVGVVAEFKRADSFCSITYSQI